jgi:hypothetical protein
MIILQFWLVAIEVQTQHKTKDFDIIMRVIKIVAFGISSNASPMFDS